MQLNINDVIQQSKSVISEVKKAILGKDEIIIKVFMAILAKGHILIEDIPGVGKTTLALAFSKVLSLNYQRLQFTPDVLPTDVTGFSVYNKNTGTFEYKPGAAVCNLFLADEINRTSSKTQSALLEIMEEGRVTVDGITREMPKPYIVIATQNPIGSIGTQLLPESQLDRFSVRLTMGYPDIQSEINILKGKQSANPLDSVRAILTEQDIIALQNAVEQVYIDDKVFEYIANLIVATRNHPLIKLGVSPRGALSLTRMAKSSALLHGRDHVIPDDVRYILKDVTAHRILLNSKAKINDVTVSVLLDDIIKQIPVPKINA